MRRHITVCLAISGLLTIFTSTASAGTIVDPAGDTFNTGTLDLTSTDLLVDTFTTTLKLTFAGAIAAPSAFAPNSLVGFVDLDTNLAAPGGTAPWGGPVTGGNNWINFFIPPNPGTPAIPGPTVALGDEFYLDLGSELFHPGQIDIVSTATNLTVGLGSASYVGSTFTVSFLTSLLGNPSAVNYGTIAGDFLSPTDRAPNGAVGSAATVAPEPGTIALFGFGIAVLLRKRLRR